MTRARHKSVSAIKNINPIIAGWLLLLIPFVGPLISIYFDYKSLQFNKCTAKILAYTIVIILLFELHDIHSLEAIFLIILGIFIIWDTQAMRSRMIPVTMENFFISVNRLLDYPYYASTQKSLHVNDINAEMYNIDLLDGDQFELYMVKLLRSVGFKNVKHTPFSNDGGLDAVGYLPNGKTKVGWQFKHYNQGRIGYNAVEQTACGGLLYSTKINYLLTNRPKLTKDAVDKVNQIDDNLGYNYIQVDTRDYLRDLVKMNKQRLHFDKNMRIKKNNIYKKDTQKESDFA